MLINQSLGTRLLAIYLPIVTVTLIVLFAFLEYQYYLNERVALATTVDELVTVQEPAITSAVWEVDVPEINRRLVAIRKLEYVSSTSVRNSAGKIISSAGNIEVEPEVPEFRATRKLLYDSGDGKEHLGTLQVTVHSKVIHRALIEHIKLRGITLLVLVVVLSVGTIYAARTIVIRPLTALTKSAEQIAEGDYAIRLPVYQNDEIGHLTKSFNKMASTIAEYMQTLENKVEERTEKLSEKEKQLSLALDNMSDGMFLMDKDQNYILINERYKELMGLGPELLAVGKSVRGVVEYLVKRGGFPSLEIEEAIEQRMEQLSGADAVHMELHVPDGSILELRQAPAKDVGTVVVATDITERKQAEKSVKRSEAILNSIIDQSPISITLRDTESRLLIANATHAAWFGHSQDEMLSTPTKSYTPDDQTDMFAAANAVVLNTEQPSVPLEYKDEKPFREPMDLIVQKFPVKGADNELIGIGTIQTDITDRKRAEEEIRLARDTAEEATKAKATFLATMSHEIRTPMGGVIGMVDLLQQSKMTDDQRQMINTVGDSAQSLLTIINDILDFSKIEAGKLDLEEVPISVCEVVEGAGEALAVTARNKNIGLSVYVDPDIPDALIGDQVRLRQILFNFGTNAIKFTEKGKVLIRADKMPSRSKKKVTVRFQVIDEGIGIPVDAQKKLFEAFSQVDASTTRRFGGTGLGLTICQRLTEIMNGEIGVESVLGEGSSFSTTVALPIAREHTIESDGHDLAGLNILFAHHDDDLRELTPRYLEHWNATVTTTAEIDMIKQIALDAANEGVPFDVICLGSGWPTSKQVETVEFLQAEKNLSVVRFVITCRDRVKANRKDLDNTVYVDAGPLRRATFIKSVAVATGRASPDVEYEDSETTLDVRTPPTVAEAEAMGQLILLAEDNLTNQDVIRRQLTMLGYTLVIANDGEEALELLKSKSFAILLTDCHMPNMNGFELTQTIRKSEEDKDTHFPIVAVTASVMKEEVDRCFASGMDDFIAKPMEMKKLKEILQKWMPVLEHDAAKVTNEIASEHASDNSEITDSGDEENGAIDPSALKSVFGDDEETFKEILNDFVEPASSNVSEIEAALNDHSADGVARAAHKLKSSSRSVGANELADLCQSLETAGNSDDWDEIDISAPRLKGILQKVTNYIKAL